MGRLRRLRSLGGWRCCRRLQTLLSQCRKRISPTPSQQQRELLRHQLQTSSRLDLLVSKYAQVGDSLVHRVVKSRSWVVGPYLPRTQINNFYFALIIVCLFFSQQWAHATAWCVELCLYVVRSVSYIELWSTSKSQQKLMSTSMSAICSCPRSTNVMESIFTKHCVS